MSAQVGEVRLGAGVSGEAVVAALEGFAAGGARVVVVEAGAEGWAAAWGGERVRWLWRDYPLPLVFAFEGRLAGAGASLALGCDLRVCGAGASIALEEASRDGPTAERARTLLAAGEGERLPATLTAEEALARGLVSRMGAAGSAGEVARGAATAVAARGPIATRLAKEALWRGLGGPLEEGLRLETDLTLLLQATKDRAEGVRAFLEKRPPEFTGG